MKAIKHLNWHVCISSMCPPKNMLAKLLSCIKPWCIHACILHEHVNACKHSGTYVHAHTKKCMQPCMLSCMHGHALTCTYTCTVTRMKTNMHDAHTCYSWCAAHACSCLHMDTISHTFACYHVYTCTDVTILTINLHVWFSIIIKIHKTWVNEGSNHHVVSSI